MAGPTSQQTPAADEERIRASLPTLIGLNRSAATLSLHHAGIRAAQSGNYLSSFKGRGMEFDESRLYTPGDDVRNLDWRVTARTGKTHTKLFREERERPVFVSVDCRNPMFFATRGMFKSVLAARLAALVAWSALQRGDRVGGQLFTETGSSELRPDHGRGAVLRLLQKLTEAVPSPDEDAAEAMDEALSRLSRHVRPGSLVFIISDFRRLGHAGGTSLIRLRRHCDLALVLVSDPLEESLPTRGRYRFAAGSEDLFLQASPAAADIHWARFSERRDAVAELARQHRMRFIHCRTPDDPLSVLRQSLHTRAAIR